MCIGIVNVEEVQIKNALQSLSCPYACFALERLRLEPTHLKQLKNAPDVDPADRPGAGGQAAISVVRSDGGLGRADN